MALARKFHRVSAAKTIWFAAIFIIQLAAVTAIAEIRCDDCGKVISGVYYVSPDGKSYCESCWKSGAVCAQCGKFTRSPVKVDALDFCSACFSKLPRCSLCSRPMAGSFTRYPDAGLQVCPACEREKPHCQRCGLPVDKIITIDDVNICMKCLERAERCHSCGNPLLEEYSFYEGNEKLKFCLKCTQRYPRCDVCGAPSGPNGTRLDDGRYLCPDCRKIAIFDMGLVESIRAKAAKFINVNMNMPIEHKIDFSLRGRDFIKSKAKGIHGDLNGLFYRKGDEFNIYALYGLREKDYYGVLAHELGHAWQAENCPDDLSLDDMEGFAQWIAYKTLLNFGNGNFAELLKEGDSIYARGLNKMLDIEKTKGTQAVFDYIRRKETKTF